MAAAVEGARSGAKGGEISAPDVLAVTVLTSMDDAALSSVGVFRDTAGQVDALGSLAKRAGVQGVVCSPLEAATMREMFGIEALVVTPGVRPVWAAKGDQARVATPAQAVASGASHVVIGRPITEADSPVSAVERIIEER